MPDMPDGPVFKWQLRIPVLPSIVNDDIVNDNVSISESVASNDGVVPSLIYADNDASFHSDHTDDENNDQVLGVNDDEDGDVGNNGDGGNFNDDTDKDGDDNGDNDGHGDGNDNGDEDGDDGGVESGNGADGGSGMDDDVSDTNADDGFGASDNIEYHSNEDSDTDLDIEKLQQEQSTAKNEFNNTKSTHSINFRPTLPPIMAPMLIHHSMVVQINC